jgi:hypothetical protein
VVKKDMILYSMTSNAKQAKADPPGVQSRDSGHMSEPEDRHV